MPLLTPKQAAAELGISTDQLLRLTDDGAIPYVNVGRGKKRESRRYEPEDLAAFKLARRMVKPPPVIVTASRPPRSTSLMRIIDFSAEREKQRRPKPAPSKAAKGPTRR